jgi:hypothetical protein
MPIKPDITNASDALWSAAVEREQVIAALAAAPQVSRSEVEGAAQELELSRVMVYRLSSDHLSTVLRPELAGTPLSLQRGPAKQGSDCPWCQRCWVWGFGPGREGFVITDAWHLPGAWSPSPGLPLKTLHWMSSAVATLVTATLCAQPYLRRKRIED